MAYSFQLVIDSAEPHSLADWWAETLGWVVEAQDPAFIRSMIERGSATEDETCEHNGALVWRTGCAINPPQDSAPQPRILFQAVPEQKSGKNRVHIDVRIGDEDPAIVRERLVSRGATVLHEGQQGPHRWVTMADPEGNEFCVDQRIGD
jgi:Glyoxalase-like domain